ncbi:DUF952 domain-containing protein [Yunchengibacter salinarum]|uniref:DUF952 domain-containing protein n=1 Tax=Yunchengibacter salinarum TaxID=3133399 RepID=UPI0035B67CCB
MTGPAFDSRGHAFKVLTLAQWRDLRERGSFSGSPVDVRDGYIHLSSREQLGATLEKHFKGSGPLILAAVNLGRLGDAPLRFEPARGGDLFPHLYGPLPLGAISAHWTLDPPDHALPPDLPHSTSEGAS